MASSFRVRPLLISSTIFLGLISHAFSVKLPESSIPAPINSIDVPNDATYLQNDLPTSALRIRRQTPEGGCIVPQSMANGTFSVRGSIVVKGGELAPYDSILQLTCPSGYLPSKSGFNFCDETKNDWFEDELATCQKPCKPPKSLTVEFTCTIPSKDGQFIRGSCDTNLPSGTTATPKCRSGHHSLTINRNIFCMNGRWGYSMPSCKAECGKPTPLGSANVINGTNANKGEFPWHVAVYTKYGHKEANSTPSYWCGGSIISRSLVITAAHCFYDQFTKRSFDVNLFTAVVGKVFSDFVHPEESMDPFIQKTEVKRIEIPADYNGELSSYSHDLAILLLQTPFTFSNLIMPVCLNLVDKEFDEDQSSPGLNAKVVGFGLDQVNGEASVELKTAVLPIISKNQCKSDSPQEFTKYIIWDKICAGYTTGIGVCKGDSGGGLVVSSIERNTTTWYLRGIVSTSPASENNDKCSTNTYSTFTKPFVHKEFIEDIMYKEGCTMPSNPLNGKFAIIGFRNAAPGEGVGHKSQISLRCDKGYTPTDAENNICDEFIDDWIKEFPTCEVTPVTPQATVSDTHISVSNAQPSTRTEGCVIPNHPPNGRYTALNLDDKKPGDILLPGSIISLECTSGYSSTSEANVCDVNTNNWKSNLGTCSKMCDSLDSVTVKFSCSNPLSKDLANGCDVPVSSGSLATLTCEVGHYSKERLPTLLCKDGFWDQTIPKCTAICGKSASDSLIISEDNDKYAKKGEFPWHAVIYYRRPNDMLRYHCGGIIISRQHVISTGHCVSPLGIPIKPRELLVAVGKLFSELNHTEEIEHAYIQKIQVKKIELPIVFGAVSDEYTNDLAILVLETPIIFSEYVMPICLDLHDSEKDKQQSKDGTLARVAGFGYENDKGPISERLKALTLPIIDIPMCKKIANENFVKDLTPDRICAGAVDGRRNLCKGDSGSGLVISNVENGTTVWYLRGVAILVPSCDPQYLSQYTVFTRPLYYTYFIESVLNARVSD